MTRIRRGLVAATALLTIATTVVTTAGQAAHGSAPPNRVLIVLFDQMLPKYADEFDMPNFRELRDAGTNFTDAYLGYMASETVISHNVIVSGQLPAHMGWVDEEYRDVDNLLGFGANQMHITGDLSLANFGTLVDNEGYPKLADYLHAKFPGTTFITVGEKSYAVESATASSGDIAVRMSSRRSDITSDYAIDGDGNATGGCRNLTTNYPELPGLNGQWRYPFGKNVPSYLLEPDATDPTLCGRFFINADKNNDYGTKDGFPSWLYPEEGDRFIPGTDQAALAGHLGGDTWAADAAIVMMQRENWSGMFVTLGGIDKNGHMWGADNDSGVYDCSTGAGQTHVRCAAENADVQLGKMLDAVAALDESDGGETLVVLTADHGATYGLNFYGKQTPGASDSNWYYAPNVIYGGVLDNVTYVSPSPALQPLLDTGNIQASYQSTAIEAWLTNTSGAKKEAAAQAMLQVPGVLASYWHAGQHFRFFGKNVMTPSEKVWWSKHGQELVDTMAAPNGPDVIGLLHDFTSYGVYGDHGGAQEAVQRVPMVFWSPSNEFANATESQFRTPDVLPTILQAMGIDVIAPMDGKARPLD